MFKRKMITGIMPMVLLTVFGIMFFAACSDDGKKADGGGGGGNIDVPDNPPVVTGGSVGNDPIAKEAIENLETSNFTEANLGEFIEELESALGTYFSKYRNKYGIEGRSVRALPNEYEKWTEKGKSNYKEFGDFTGRVEIITNFDLVESLTSESGYESEAYKFFDYSNSGTLFLGGGLGILWTAGSGNNASNIYQNITKYNGTIEFMGTFKGKIVFNNIVLSEKYQRIKGEYCNTDQYGNEYCYDDWDREEIEYKITSGSFYVENSNGNKISLPAELLDNFYTDSDEYDYGEDQITIKIPPVPAAPNGNLTDRGGIAVDNNNLNAFLRAFYSELYDRGRMPRAANEDSETQEWLEHGKQNGYTKGNGDWNWQENNTGSYNSNSKSIEYSDYSNIGLLYFGGGYGSAYYSHYKNTGSSSNERDNILNGKVKFTGDFKGTLDFQNFKYRYEYEYNSEGFGSSNYTVTGGRVMIGSLDITNEYLEYIVKGEFIP